MEGSICGPGAPCGPPKGASCPCGDSSLVSAIHEYPHNAGGFAAVTGGYVYRGNAIPGLRGTYLFADWSFNTIVALQHDGSTATLVQDVTADLDPPGFLKIQKVASFGEDNNGEIYVCDYSGGEIFKIVGGCVWDLNGNGNVGVTDLLGLLAAWGTNPGGPPDFDGNGDVGVTDLLALLAAWGLCG